MKAVRSHAEIVIIEPLMVATIPEFSMKLTSNRQSRNLRETSPEPSAMATKHNITVAIEPTLLKKARAVAASRGLSVSALLASQLRELVADDAQYKVARKRAASLFDMPLPLGGSPLSREVLHDRRRIR
jgi:hypothetical protein